MHEEMIPGAWTTRTQGDANMQLEEILKTIQTLRKDATTTGISSVTGLNFYYLEPTAKTIYPVFYPLLASIPRYQPTFNGMIVGGQAVNWKAVTAVDTGGYPMLSEGNRNALMNITEKNYAANYKFLGKDTQVSFAAQQMGLGFEDNIGLAQVSLLNALLNDEERAILFSNDGSSGNGFQLGTGPTCASNVTANATGGATTLQSLYVSVYCVALTGWGVLMCGSTGVQLPYTRQNADGSTDTINGGTSAISTGGVSAQLASSGSPSATCTVTAVAGALGYAWFVGTSSSVSTVQPVSSCYFYSQTSAPTVTVTGLPTATNQAGDAPNHTDALANDCSANTLDFTGLFAWGATYASAAKPSYWKDLGGANMTANGDGTIAEIETMMDFFWLNYKITPDKLWLGGTLIDAFSKKVLGSGVANNVMRVFLEQDSAGRVVGGTFAVAYRSKYGPGQMKQLDVQTHPWIPQGVILADLINNPYPAAGNAIPAVRRMATLEDHFSIKWPYIRLQHQVGVYCFETLQHYIPFGLGVITGIGSA
jgi:hypothetical protein